MNKFNNKQLIIRIQTIENIINTRQNLDIVNKIIKEIDEYMAYDIQNTAIQYRLEKCFQNCYTIIIKEHLRTLYFENAQEVYHELCRKLGKEIPEIEKIINRKLTEYEDKLRQNLSNSDNITKQKILEDNVHILPTNIYEKLHNENFKEEINKLEHYLVQNNFKKAYEIANLEYSLNTKKEKFKKVYKAQMRYIDDLLENNLFKDAKQLIEEVIKQTPQEYKEYLKKYYSNIKEYYEIKSEIIEPLIKWDFDTADKIFEKHLGNFFPDPEEYLIWKKEYIEKYTLIIIENLKNKKLDTAQEQLLQIQTNNSNSIYAIDTPKIIIDYIQYSYTEIPLEYLEKIINILPKNYKSTLLQYGKLHQLLEKYHFEQADEFIRQNSEIISNDKYENLKTKYINSCIELIESSLEQQDLKKAYKLVQNLQDNQVKNDFINKIEETIKKYVLSIIENKTIHFNKSQIPDIYRHRITYAYALQKLLKNNDFLKADTEYEKTYNYLFTQQKYEKIKAKYIQKYFTNLNIDINEEQSRAISKISQNVLVTARAGSGKTRTIACRAILALEKENFKPEEIILLSFNKAAANEMKNRIRTEFRYEKFNNKCARTFHSIAWGIVNPKEDILRDDSDNYVEQKLTNFISNLYHSTKVFNDEFKSLLYQYYRESNNENQYNIDCFQSLTKEEKYEHLRNKKLITLNGERVKSNGEKWIADFLFEHDKKYRYEKQLTCEKNNKKGYLLYNPDFTIYDKDSKTEYIIEHWGIDENDPDQKVPEYWNKSWEEYYNEMQWKRKICNNKYVKLIETDITMLQNGRKHFEKTLKEILTNNGITCQKLEKDEIFKRLEEKHKDEMAKKFAQFILFAQKSKIEPQQLKEKLKNKQYLENPRDYAFLTMVSKVYEMYHKELSLQNKTDDDQVLLRATNKILSTKGNCEIKLDNKQIKIKDIKFIMIDEFQDTSELFIDLIKAIIKFNPQIKLFCVGDDWQAINGFAASNLDYFNSFDKIFLNSNQTTLTFNYRSGPNIIRKSNLLMENQSGKPAECKNTELNDNINLQYIDDVNILNELYEIDKQYIYDQEEDYYNILKTYNTREQYFGVNHRYFKICSEIISKTPNKSFIIMNRTNKIANYHNLDLFEDKLKKHFRHTDIKVGSIHKFKGLEADIAIILECNQGVYPLIHPDNSLYSILGRNAKNILDEERRLFYVALTRGREQVYCISSKNKESDYLKDINLLLDLDDEIDKLIKELNNIFQ